MSTRRQLVLADEVVHHSRVMDAARGDARCVHESALRIDGRASMPIPSSFAIVVGQRDADWAEAFLQDLRERIDTLGSRLLIVLPSLLPVKLEASIRVIALLGRL